MTLDHALEKILNQHYPAQITHFNLLASGWESDIYSVDVKSNGVTTGWALRYFAPGRTVEEAQKEWKVLSQLAELGYPVPQVWQVPPTDRIDGRLFLLMQRIDGYPLWSSLKTAEDYRAALPVVARLMRDLHSIKPEEFDIGGELPSSSRQGIRMMLAEWRQKTVGSPASAAFEPVFDWFESHVEKINDMPLALVHFDLHPQNVMVEKATGKHYVIDWTGASFNDPRMDVFWAALLLGHQTALPLFDLMIQSYEEVTGKQLTDRPFFEAVVCIRRIATLMLTMTGGSESVGMLENVSKNIGRQIPILRKIYERWLRATDELHIGAIEEFFDHFA